MTIKNCSCETRDFPCSYHFFEFLKEQGLSKPDARDVTAVEFGAEAGDVASSRDFEERRTDLGRPLAQRAR